MLIIFLFVPGAGSVSVVETDLAAREESLLAEEDHGSAKARTNLQNALGFLDLFSSGSKASYSASEAALLSLLPQQPRGFVGLERQAGGNKTNRRHYFFRKRRRKK